MYLAQSQRGKNVNFSSRRVGRQKSKLGYRYEELGAVKAKKKKKKKNKECSGLLTVLLIFFVLRKGKEKNSFLFFPFHCNRTTSHTFLLWVSFGRNPE